MPFLRGEDVSMRTLSTKTYPLVHHLTVTNRVRMTRTVRDVKGNDSFDNSRGRKL
jgi:hypothetical protein